MNFQCRLFNQEKACDECDFGGTALLCFGFRLEHLVDQMLDCERLIMARTHGILELTVGTEVPVIFHRSCAGKIYPCLAMSSSRLATARKSNVYLAFSLSRR